jgi:SsrA-binding protein
MKSDPSNRKKIIVATNRKAAFSYHLMESVEAGLALSGAEIKSIRTGDVTLNESYVSARGEELYVYGLYIKPYKFSRDIEDTARRPRKLLLHRSEINKLRGRAETKGLTIIPTSLSINERGFAKLEIALAKGKNAPDKRDTIKDREGKREVERALKQGGK